MKEIQGGSGERKECKRKGNNGPLGREGLTRARRRGGKRVVTPGRRALGEASRKHQAAPGKQRVKGVGPGAATCRGERLLALPELFVSRHW